MRRNDTVRRPSRLLLPTLAFLSTVIVACIGLALQTRPLVGVGPDITVADVDRARYLLREHDPRRDQPGVLRYLDVSQSDLDLLFNLGSKRLGNASARVVLEDAAATLQTSIRLDRLPLGPWLNIAARIRVVSGLPLLDSVRIGRLPVPVWLADLAIRQAMKHLEGAVETKFVANMIQSMRITPAELQVAYRWSGDSTSHLKSLLVSAADVERLGAYQTCIATAVAKVPTTQPVSLVALIEPAFGLAQRRSVDGDAGSENRSAILAMAFYVNGRDLAALIPEFRDWPAIEYRTVTLNNRVDLPRHFLISAALAAESSRALADVIGLYKEVDDTHGGSGFSFTDLAANRAGTRFGHLAVLAPARLQRVLAAGIEETDFMPDLRDLPEFMPEAEFKRRFGGVDAPAYRTMMAGIEAQIAALPLFR